MRSPSFISKKEGSEILIKKVDRKKPIIDEGAWIAADADVIGEAHIAKGVSVWFHAVIRADQNAVLIGENTNIQDGCILHTDPDDPLIIGKDVSVGHGAILHGCTIEDHCLIGMGSIIMNRAIVHPYCIIGAGALVKEGMEIPSGSVVVGCPAKIIAKITDEQRKQLEANAQHYQEWKQIYQREDEEDGSKRGNDSKSSL